MDDNDDRYSFLVDWFDPMASINRRFLLNFYDKESSVEMFDIKNHRQFLKKCKVENIHLDQLFVGNSVNILSRQLNVVDFADDYTRRRIGVKKERTLGLIKPDALGKMGHILDIVWKSGLQITNLKMVQLTQSEASAFYQDQKSSSSLGQLVESITSGPVVAFEIRGENALKRWLEILGPGDPAQARARSSSTIRAQYGADSARNACHGSDSLTSAEREVGLFFPSGGVAPQNSACFADSTCCLIKPHAVAEGIAGAIISSIIECGFEISAMTMFALEKLHTEEFLEVYRGVVQEYPSMVTELCSGPCVAMEIRAQDAARTFREFVGPADPEIARHIRPRTLRARFGRTKIRNAVHCTDLPEDAPLEVEYFFKILDR